MGRTDWTVRLCFLGVDVTNSPRRGLLGSGCGCGGHSLSEGCVRCLVWGAQTGWVPEFIYLLKTYVPVNGTVEVTSSGLSTQYTYKNKAHKHMHTHTC